MPEWLLPTAFVAGFFAVLVFIASRNTRRGIERVLARRPNPSWAVFLELMQADVSAEASEFLWGKSMEQLSCFRPAITPHPDDHLVDDLPIDDEEWSIDWPRDWAKLRGFHESSLPDWPKDWPATVRNFGRWLDMGPQ